MVIRLENTSGRHNKFYELICEYWHITTRFGAIYSVCPTFFLLNFALIQIFQVFGGIKDSGLSSMVVGLQQVWQLAQALPGECGIAGTELYSSRAGYLEHIFSKLQEKLAGGYKIVFPGPLPPPVSPDVPTLAPPVPKGSKASRGRGGSTVASRGVKRKTASTPPAKEPPAGVRRSKRARKESEKQKEAREKKEKKQAEKEAKQGEKEKERKSAAWMARRPEECAGVANERSSHCTRGASFGAACGGVVRRRWPFVPVPVLKCPVSPTFRLHAQGAHPFLVQPGGNA